MLLLTLYLFLALLVGAGSVEAVPVVPLLAEERNLPPAEFRRSCSIIWGEKTNLKELKDKVSVLLVLDRHSGAGFMSKQAFLYGFFSAAIKLPRNYSAGVITAFYTSNQAAFPGTHDELDFEFLGVVPGMPYTLQTNIYANGSIHTGREERFRLWFDPTEDFHRYSIIWNQHHIVFFVDSVPIRQMRRKDVRKAEEYPSKPMSMYATIWDGSQWATSGGKFPVDYSKQPFVASFTNIKMRGQLTELDNQKTSSSLGEDLSWKQKIALGWARQKYMTYSYCNDKPRYPKRLPDCQPRKEIETLETLLSRKTAKMKA